MNASKNFSINRSGRNLINPCSAKTLEGNPHVRGFKVNDRPTADLPLIEWQVKDYTLFQEELEAALRKACEVSGILVPEPQTDEIYVLRTDPLGGAEDFMLGSNSRTVLHRTCVGKFDVTGVPVYVEDLPAWFGILAALKQGAPWPLSMQIPLYVEAYGDLRTTEVRLERLRAAWPSSPGWTGTPRSYMLLGVFCLPGCRSGRPARSRSCWIISGWWMKVVRSSSAGYRIPFLHRILFGILESYAVLIVPHTLGNSREADAFPEYNCRGVPPPAGGWCTPTKDFHCRFPPSLLRTKLRKGAARE